jgi:hypothetical protein
MIDIQLVLVALQQSLPALLLGVLAVGVALYVRCRLDERRRRQRFESTVRQLREAQTEQTPPVVIQSQLPLSLVRSRLGAHLSAVVGRLERAVTLLDEGNDNDAGHELRRALIHCRGVQREYAPSKPVTPVTALSVRRRA